MPDRPSDRQALGIVLALAIMAVAVHVDKLWMGARGPQRAHDGGDVVVTTLVGCGRFWTDPSTHAWDPTILRGWPALPGTVPPPYLGCLIAAALPPPAVWPILQVLLLWTLAAGSFLFLLIVLRYPTGPAFAGALFNVGLFYWFHENDMVASAVLLAPLVGFLAIDTRGVAQVVRAVGLMAIIGLSNPANTLFIMPAGHLALLLCVDATRRRRHLGYWAAFWLLYGIYYGPTLLAYATHLSASSRSLFARAGANGQPFVTLLQEALTNRIAVVTPAFVLLALSSRQNWTRTLWAASGLVALAVLRATNSYLLHTDLAAQHQWVFSLYTMFYRAYYFIGVVVFLWGSSLIRSLEIDRRWTAHLRRIVLVIVFAWVANRLLGPIHSGQFRDYAIWIGLGVMIATNVPTRYLPVTVLAATLFVAPLRAWYSEDMESPWQGNVFLEGPIASGSIPQRTVTVMRTCDASDLFPAQAAITGRETLDGIANFYDRGFAERWQFYVTEGSTGCTKRFAGWNTRVEVTPDDLAHARERIMSWLWINGVDEIRSTAPIDDPGLRLDEVRHQQMRFHGEVTRYRYRVNSPLGRVFVVSDELAQPAGDFTSEYRMLQALQRTGSVSSVPVDSYSGGRLTFSGELPPATTVLISTNYHKGWRLLVDGREDSARLSQGSFGMIAVHPAPGRHTY
ncbi:MAG: hypothetical protein HY655_15205, partial [Acidobacteria bacterium]|nr:hypothetical protein [Acidobacteriota bacterium]